MGTKKKIFLICIFFSLLITACEKDNEKIDVPSVSTAEVGVITENSAVSGGLITSDGGTEIIEKGVCWSISPNPTTLGLKTNDGKGTGSFSSMISNLSPGTTYYVRAYAKNNLYTAYGNERTFITEPAVNIDTLTGKGVLFIEITEKDGSLLIHAIFSEKDTSYTLPDKNKILSTCNSIDDIISFHQSHNLNLLDENINYLSDLFINPLANYFAGCELINIKINDISIKIPYEFLRRKGNFIYTEKPIVYSFSKLDPSELSIIKPERGLIISDPTADPENACGQISEKFENSQFYFIKDVNISIIKNTTDINFILFSVHGALDLNTCLGFMSINNEKLYPGTFSKTKLKLIYFDSCHQGKSINFVNKFHELEAEYLLGPITSNEAGNSSTKTIINFFNNLEDCNPVESLFRTKQLLKKYQHSNLLNELFFAAPFRIYKL